MAGGDGMTDKNPDAFTMIYDTKRARQYVHACASGNGMTDENPYGSLATGLMRRVFAEETPADMNRWLLAQVVKLGGAVTSRNGGAVAPDLAVLRELLETDPESVFQPTLYHASDALKPQAPLDWIVQDILSAGSVSMLVGDAGSGKTYMALDLAVSVARSKPWLGYAVNGGPVLWVDEESGNRRLSLRLGDVLRGHDAGPETPIAYTTLNRFDLWQQGDVFALAAAILRHKARLVVFDALMELLPGRDENTVKDVLPGLLALRNIAEATGAALLVIHHANKAGGYRGSSAIKGAVDLLLTVENNGAGVVTVKSDKARDVDSVKFAALMNFGPDAFNLSPAIAQASKPVFGKGEKHVLLYLFQHGPASVETIAAAADICAPGTARNAVYTLAEKGLVARQDDGARGAAAVYQLTPAGQEQAGKL